MAHRLLTGLRPTHNRPTSSTRQDRFRAPVLTDAARYFPRLRPVPTSPLTCVIHHFTALSSALPRAEEKFQFVSPSLSQLRCSAHQATTLFPSPHRVDRRRCRRPRARGLRPHTVRPTPSRAAGQRRHKPFRTGPPQPLPFPSVAGTTLTVAASGKETAVKPPPGALRGSCSPLRPPSRC
jgi:hypothetical protein